MIISPIQRQRILPQVPYTLKGMGLVEMATKEVQVSLNQTCKKAKRKGTGLNHLQNVGK